MCEGRAERRCEVNQTNPGLTVRMASRIKNVPMRAGGCDMMNRMCPHGGRRGMCKGGAALRLLFMHKKVGVNV